TTGFSHVADRASEDPKANTKELWEVYATLRRARAALYGSRVDSPPGDLDAASAAINDVVSAEDSAAMSDMVNLEVTDYRGGKMSYAEALKTRTHDRWTPEQMDVTFTSDKEWTYRPRPAKLRPAPAR